MRYHPGIESQEITKITNLCGTCRWAKFEMTKGQRSSRLAAEKHPAVNVEKIVAECVVDYVAGLERRIQELEAENARLCREVDAWKSDHPETLLRKTEEDAPAAPKGDHA